MPRNQIRIIGGQWRSRLIRFTNAKELRPTPDRVRETLFNWLSPHIENVCCLDLYSGTGVLCFEALSRGAAKAIAVEKDPENIKALYENIKLLNTQSFEIIKSDVITWLEKPNTTAPFDIVFVDPPYKAMSLPTTFTLLEKNHFLKPGSFIYFEFNDYIDATAIPNTWQLLRQKKAGVVHYHLAQKR